MIQIYNLTKKFENHEALSNVYLSIKRGSVYGLVGPNGSGKTTLIKHITGVYMPDSGSVEIDKEDVLKNPFAKQNMVYIPDDLYFPPTFSALDMAKFYSGVYKNFSWDKFYELSNVFEIDMRRNVMRLSKGMQKQVAFWICISCNPEIIVMDEPVDGLDPVMRRIVWSIILKEVSERQCTVLISSHNLRELEDVCDHVGILYNGKLLLEKSLDEIKSDIFKLQLAFKNDMPSELIEELNIAHKSVSGKVTILIIRGNKDEILEKVNSYDPILADIIPLSLEEVFIYELGGKGYDFKNLLY